MTTPPRAKKAPSQHKAVIYFNDGKRGSFKSNDKFTTQNTINPNRGLNALRALIKKHMGKYESAMIYKLPEDTLLEQYDGNATLMKPKVKVDEAQH